MKLFLLLASRKGYAVLNKLIAAGANISGILCLVEDPHEEPYHEKITGIATKQSIPIFYSTHVKSNDYAKLFNQVKPDVIFAIGWRYLITKEAYEIPRHGTFILHDSLLPAYRGFAPLNWAIINGEMKTGVTLFQIAEGVDSGPIVDQLAVDIALTDTARTLEEKIITLYENIIIKNLPAFQAGKITTTPQDESLATYTCKRTPEDGEINWQQSAMQIYNFIRALTKPFPGAYTRLNGKKLFIWKATLPQTEEHYVGVVPGRVLGKKDHAIQVLTGNGVLQLHLVQFENESETTAEDFIISVKDTLGR